MRNSPIMSVMLVLLCAGTGFAQFDFSRFPECMGGPGGELGPGCSLFQMDGDADVDLADFARFQLVYDAPPVGMALIPAGEFEMGSMFDEAEPDELPVHSVYVNAFYMDRCEVTNRQYADALNWANDQGDLIAVIGHRVFRANSGTDYPYCSALSGSDHVQITWDGDAFGVVPGREDHPMVTVTWYGAVAYANWRSGMEGKPLAYDLSTWECSFGSGYRLPTEAEWEKAARGGEEEQRFPWGDLINHTHANYVACAGWAPYDDSGLDSATFHPEFDMVAFAYTNPVDYFPANGYGLRDMAGNIYDWCNDWYNASYYEASPYVNPHGPANGQDRVLRGGSWNNFAPACRSACRYATLPVYLNERFGFRLVLDSH